jgi:two-component system, NtrC family, sensor histidine kinase KinB
MRKRILIGLLPLLILLIAVGCYAIALFARLGGAIDVILRENYASVVASQNMKESAERMDSALFFTLEGESQRSRTMYDENLPIFEKNLTDELHNITVPGEADLAYKVRDLHQEYVDKAKTFLSTKDVAQRRAMYFDKMLPLFTEIKDTAQAILELNQSNMAKANDDARQLSAKSVVYMLIAMAVGLAGALFFAHRLQRSILNPIQSLTTFSKELGDGNLDQVVPVMSDDELGQLGDAFNKMATKLRAYRQITSDEILQARQMTEITFSAFPDPIIAFDAYGDVNFKNPAAEKLLQKLHLDDHLPEQLTEQVEAVLKGGEDYVPVSFANAICVRPDDKETFFLPRVIGIRGDKGAIFGGAVILQNVTRLRLVDELKTNLVSTVSHELKTPLTSVRMAVHLLLEESIGELNSKQSELLIAARDDAERLLTMINDLLDLARLESGTEHMMLEPRTPGDLVRDAIGSSKDVADQRRVRLVSAIDDGLPMVSVEWHQISHVFSNLIHNAVKHSPAGEEVIVKAVKEDGGVRFSVADKGPGIPAKFQPYLFEKFYRAPGADKTGAGLGLSIAREIVRAHHGSIGVHSAPGEGAEFYFDLPYYEGAPMLSKARPEILEAKSLRSTRSNPSK